MAEVGETSHSEAELLRRLQRGENEAWAEFTRAMTPRLMSYLRHNVPTIHDAEDVLGETLVAIVRSLPSFDGNASLSTFVFSLAYRKVADFWRRRRDNVELLDQRSAPGVSSHAVEFQELLDSLPEISKQVLILRYHVGLSVSEIAEIVDRSYKGTESLLSRARNQLREAVEATGFGHE